MFISHRDCRPGLLLVELLASLTIVLVLVGALAWFMTQTVRSGDAVHGRRRAIAAAETVLNELREGVAAERLTGKRRFDDLDVAIRRDPGEDAWAGFERVTVTVVAPLPNGGAVTERLAGYLPGGGR